MEFANVKDDNERLNEHTKYLLQQLTDVAENWTKKRYDGRAIYSALAILHHYYHLLGMKEMGDDYMHILNNQAWKLSKQMVTRSPQDV